MSIIEDKELYQQGNVWKLQLEVNDLQKSKERETKQTQLAEALTDDEVNILYEKYHYTRFLKKRQSAHLLC